MSHAGIIEARIGNVPGGFSVLIELRRGHRLDTWGVSLVKRFEAAEDVVMLFATQHAVPWKDVEVVKPSHPSDALLHHRCVGQSGVPIASPPD